MRRRDLLWYAAGIAAWPHVRRRIGVLMNTGPEDQEQQARAAAFVKALNGLGWTQGHNVQIEFRWASGDAARLRTDAMELVALAPDVILTAGGFGLGPLQQATRTIPIVFVSVADPVGSGFVNSLARPGGNTTGFANFEYGISAKWLELLKQIAPRISRGAIIRDPALPSGAGMLGALQSVAPSLRVELILIGVSEPAEIESAIKTFAQWPDGGLVATPNAAVVAHRGLIIERATAHRLPSVYPYRYFTTEGGLMSYGPDTTDQYRLAAGYVDRILRGEKPADLPVQAPTKFELVINLKTAKALGLTVPQSLLARADEVIE